MNKLLAMVLCLVMCLLLLGCGNIKEPDEMMLDNILHISEYQLEEALLGQTRQQIHDRWGDPSGTLNDPSGEFFRIPYSQKQITVYYNDKNIVTEVKIEPVK